MAERERTKAVSVVLKLPTWQHLRQAAAEDGTSMTALCLQWIRAGLSRRLAGKCRGLADGEEDRAA